MPIPVSQQKGLKDIPSGHIDVCQICSSNNLQPVIEMGFFAPCDSLLTLEMLKRSEKSYPLNLVRCRAENEFGFKVKTSFEDCLKKTIEWYNANPL